MSLFRNALPRLGLWLAVPVSCVSMCVHAAPSIVAEIEPSQRVVVSAEVQGVVDQVVAFVGDSVTSQQPLVVFEKEDYVLDVEMAEAQVRLSQAELNANQRQYKRLKTLYTAKNVSLSQLDDQQRLYEVSRSEVKVNRINLKLAERRLAKATISAPFQGIVSQRFVEKGQLLNPGDQVLELVAIDQINVVFNLLEMDYLDVSVGDRLSVEATAVNDAKYEAVISRIAPSEAGGRPGYRVEATMPNPHGRLKPGFTVRVSPLEDSEAVVESINAEGREDDLGGRES